MKTATVPYTLQYNGKELQLLANTTLTDYGARQYNPTLARWTAQDPMAEKYYNFSPYAYCIGNPISMVDENGEDWYKTTEINDEGEEEVKYHFSYDIRSQEDLANAKINGTYLGITAFVENGSKYLNLFGGEMHIDFSDPKSILRALTISNLDNAIIAKYKESFENSLLSYPNQDFVLKLVDMNLYLNGHKLNGDIKEKFTYTTKYCDGKVIYNIARNLDNSYFSWGDGVFHRRNLSFWGINYPGVVSKVQRYYENYDPLIWIFPSKDSWQSAKNRATAILGNRKTWP